MQFRKIAALAGSALMGTLAATAPALAATVSNVSGIYGLASATSFPVFVIGNDAKPSDVAGAIGIAAKMAAFSFEEKSVPVTTTVAAGADGVTFRMEPLNTTAKTRDFDVSTSPFIIQAPAYGGRTASFLQSGSITIGGTEYKYYEVIGITGANDTSSNGYLLYADDASGSGTYENAYKDLMVKAPSDSTHYIFYQLRFETDVPVGATNLTGKTIKFLGKDYVVTSSSTTEVKLSATGGSVFLNVGEKQTVGEYTVELLSVGTGTGSTVVCGIDVNGQRVTVNSGSTEYVTIGGKNIPVYVKNAAVVTGGGWAEILVGATSYKLTNGQMLEAPNQDWQASIGVGAAGTIRNITLKYIQPRTGPTGTYPALKTGTAITSPDNFFTVKFAGLESSTGHKISVTPRVGDFNGNGVVAESGLQIAATDPTTGNAVKVIDTGSGFADTVAYDASNGAWVYLNSTGGWTTFTGPPSITLTEGALSFAILNKTLTTDNLANDDLVLRIREPTLSESGITTSDWYIEYDFASNTTVGTLANVTEVGPTVKDGNPTYVSYNNTVTPGIGVAYGGTTPKSRSGGFASPYGTVFLGASSSGVELKVPKTQLYGDLIFGRETTAGGTGEVKTKEPVEVTADVAMLDNEAGIANVKTSSDLFVIGGPCVNKLAAELLGKTYPACGEDSGLTANTALIKVFPNAFATGKTAVLIAGWEAADTDLAARVIQLKQTEIKAQNVPAVTVSGTIESPTITAAS
ncbi:MAG: S-layer protein [Candidatus Aenigmatarchaeota archaeon]